MTVATTLETAETTNESEPPQGGDGGAFFCSMSHSILFAVLLLALLLI